MINDCPMKNILLLCALLYSVCTSAQSPLVFTKFDINPGANSSTPQLLNSYNGKLVFRARTETYGIEPWICDGTTNGTHMIKDIKPGVLGSMNEGYIDAAGKLFFEAEDSVHGEELWVTDGTTTGTYMVADLHPGPNWGGTVGGIGLGNHFIFTNNFDYELWITDGTTVGTMLLKDIPGTQSTPSSFCMYNGKIFFSARNQNNVRGLWATDGTEQGTVQVKEIYPGIHSIHNIGNKLYLTATNTPDGTEWWTSIGTTQNTQILKDINPGTGTGVRDHVITPYNGKAYFGANNGIAGIELWATDGTETGTYMVKDINPGADSGRPQQMTVHNGRLYFVANDGVHGRELWQTDGTDTGTFMVKDLFAGSESSNPDRLISYKNYLYFGARESSADTQLYRTDGTVAGTTVVRPPTATKNNTIARTWAFKVCDSTLYIPANFDSSGVELWAINDTTKPVTGIANNIKTHNYFTIYPNPNDGRFTIQLPQPATTKGTINLYDAMGRKVHTQTIAKGEHEILLQLPNVAKGIYIADLQTGEHTSTLQLVIQ